MHALITDHCYHGTYIDKIFGGILQVIEFDFTSFSLELSSSCGWDELFVYDGATVNAPSLGTYCRSDLPRPILTTGDTAALLFESDSSTVSTGFSVDYTARDHGMGETTPGVIPPTNEPSESKRVSIGPVCTYVYVCVIFITWYVMILPLTLLDRVCWCHSSRIQYFPKCSKGWRCVSPREFHVSWQLFEFGPHAKIWFMPYPALTKICKMKR